MILKNVEKITKTNLKEQTFLIRYFAKLGIMSKIDIFSKHRRIFYKLQDKYLTYGKEELSYMAFILAIKYDYSFKLKLSKKKFENMTISEVRDLTIKEIDDFMVKKSYKQIKREKILAYWGVIKVLRDKNMSFRNISEFLRKKYRLDISYSTIYNLWREIEEN